MFLTLRSLSQHNVGAAMLAAAFCAGIAASSLVGARLSGHPHMAETVAQSGRQSSLARSVIVPGGYPADVLGVIDGDTFETRVQVWPGLDVTTRVRLRGIDAPELHARCPAERIKAEAARDALSAMLAEGGIGISRIGQDKYGGRIDADVSTGRTPSVSEALFAAGYVRRYSGGHRQGWCSPQAS